MKALIASNVFTNVIIGIIVIYCLLVELYLYYITKVFASFGLSDPSYQDDPTMKEVILALLYVELVVVILFMIEIFINIYAFGFKVFLKLSNISFT